MLRTVSLDKHLSVLVSGRAVDGSGVCHVDSLLFPLMRTRCAGIQKFEFVPPPLESRITTVLHFLYRRHLLPPKNVSGDSSMIPTTWVVVCSKPSEEKARQA